MSTESEARHFLREVIITAIPAMVNEDATPEQMTRFADAITRAIAMLIESKQDPTERTT